MSISALKKRFANNGEKKNSEQINKLDPSSNNDLTCLRNFLSIENKHINF